MFLKFVSVTVYMCSLLRSQLCVFTNLFPLYKSDIISQFSCFQSIHWRHWHVIIWATLWENLLLPYANNKGADQPAHPRSLISTFVFRCLDSIIPLVSKSEISSPSILQNFLPFKHLSQYIPIYLNHDHQLNLAHSFRKLLDLTYYIVCYLCNWHCRMQE